MATSNPSSKIPRTFENAGFFILKTGEVELISVTDGYARFGPVQPTFAPLANASEVNKLLRDNFLPSDQVSIALNTLVVRKEGEIIIFDTGCGHNFGSNSGKLRDNLIVAGIDPLEVTAVFITHAHPDHIGGLTDKEGNLTYPKATVYISKAEYDFWTAPDPDFSKCKADRGFIEMMVDIARKNLEAAKGSLQFFNDGDVLFGCVRVQIIAGHTPGHTISHISAGEFEIIHMADTTHDAVLLLNNPEWGVTLDTDFEAAGVARRSTLAQLANSRKEIFSLHLPWPGVGHIRARGEAFEWVPLAFMTSQD